MVLTDRQHAMDYASLHPLFPRTFELLFQLADSPFVPGRHQAVGEEFFINAAEYDTKPQESAVLEAHRRYIDVMLLLDGEETILTAPPCGDSAFTQPYDEKSDLCLMPVPAAHSTAHMRSGSLCILFPADGHAPGINAAQTCRVHKLIAKVPV